MEALNAGHAHSQSIGAISSDPTLCGENPPQRQVLRERGDCASVEAGRGRLARRVVPPAAAGSLEVIRALQLAL
jgi:hypothetical protein